MEDKYKDCEARKTSIMFEHEKERAKWQLEKNHLQLQKDDLVQLCERLQSKKDHLMKENERLKHDKKNNRRSINWMGRSAYSTTISLSTLKSQG